MAEEKKTDQELEGMPSNVTAQGEKADELQQGLINGKTGEGSETPPETPAQAPKEGEEGKPEEEKKEFTCQVCGKSFGSQQALAAHSRVHAEKPEEEKAKGEGDFKQKYEVLQGKYDAEIPRFRQQNAELRVALDSANETISNLNTIVKELKGAQHGEEAPPEDGKATPAQAGSGQLAPTQKLNPEDFEGYGDEMKNLVSSFNALVNENAQLKNLVGGVSQRVLVSDKDRYYDKLDKAVKDWETINKTPEFVQWLDDVDLMSGRTRDSLLQEADKKMDSQRVVNIFNAFKKGKGMPLGGNGGGSSAETPPTETPKAETPSGMESELLPDESGGESAIPTEKQPILPETISKAARDYVDGKITEEKYNEITNEFQKQQLNPQPAGRR